MGTLQENQSLNAEYERNKKEREMLEEIERLNNIINELEKWLEETINNDGLSIYATEQYETVLDKLQELKGVDKE